MTKLPFLLLATLEIPTDAIKTKEEEINLQKRFFFLSIIIKMVHFNLNINANKLDKNLPHISELAKDHTDKCIWKKKEKITSVNSVNVNIPLPFWWKSIKNKHFTLLCAKKRKILYLASINNIIIVLVILKNEF